MRSYCNENTPMKSTDRKELNFIHTKVPFHKSKAFTRGRGISKALFEGFRVGDLIFKTIDYQVLCK